jgi:hypothetical protein
MAFTVVHFGRFLTFVGSSWFVLPGVRFGCFLFVSFGFVCFGRFVLFIFPPGRVV